MTEPEAEELCGATEPNFPEITCTEKPGILNAGNDSENLDVHVHHGTLGDPPAHFYWES